MGCKATRHASKATRHAIPISLTEEFHAMIRDALDRRNEGAQGTADPNWSIQRWIRQACEEKIDRDCATSTPEEEYGNV